MSTARARHRKKQYAELVQGNQKLHKEIEELETAYMIHKHYVEEDENSVKGMIRKEIGGSRWEHGGSGKLHNYKSSKDLIDFDSASNTQQMDTHQSVRQEGKSSRSNDMKGNSERKTNIDLGVLCSDTNQQRLTDLKTRVIKKASSKIVHRDTWTKDESNVMKRDSSVEKKGKRQDKIVSELSKVEKSQVKRCNFKKEGKQDEGKTTQNNSRVQKQSKHNAGIRPLQSEISVRQSRRDVFAKESGHTTKEKMTKGMEKETLLQNEYSFGRDEKQTEEGGRKINGHSEVGQNPGKTFSPRKHNSFLGDREIGKTFLTQPSEPTEIFIDPAKGHVRVTSGQDDSCRDFTNLDRTRVLIQPGSPQKSIDGQKLPCSIVDVNGGPGTHAEIRDVFGLSDFTLYSDPNADQLINHRAVAAKSPFAAAKQCNTEVEFWLRGLGIPDIDKYVNIFAENEVDLTDLEFMSASQLHDMGITAFGALDKILKGVRDLKIKPPRKDRKPSGRKKPLDASSIAWENGEVDQASEQKSVYNNDCEESVSRDRNVNSCQNNETFMKLSMDTDVSSSGNFYSGKRGDKDRYNVLQSVDVLTQHEPVRRCGSAMSNVSNSTDLTCRSDNKHRSFAASTKSSSAKCVEKRPPSAKNVSSGKLSNQKPTISGKGSNSSQAKTGVTQNKLRRSNSFTASDGKSRLAILEEKPTKGALIRPRSSSLTRESTKSSAAKTVKKTEEKTVTRNSRARSRSADAVKRKALEGVQAAAKRFEERSQQGRNVDEDTKQAREERKKQRRDEMAARHLRREQFREISGTQSSDTDDNSPSSNQAPADSGNGLESLVTVNILSSPTKSVSSESRKSPTVIYVLPPINPKKTSLIEETNRSGVTVGRSDVRNSLRRVEQPRRQSHTTVRPVELQMPSPTETPLLSTYKLGSKDRERSQSEPESGYKTDGSTTYSQIEDRVSDIQLKIKRLKARATNGDEMTLTLVRDLQTQLHHFEKQLLEAGRKKRTSDIGSQSAPETENTLSARSVSSSHSANRELNRTTAMGQLLGLPEEHNIPDKNDDDLSEAGGEKTKTENVDELKKDKRQRPQQIRHLQSMLQKVRHTDPVSSMELDSADVTFKKEDMIGQGTFSHVYKGEYQGSEVAIKQLKNPLHAQDKNYFAAEVSLLKELRHPRVVLLIGVCTAGNLPLMVLELMSRGSLYNYLHNPDSESFDHALYYQVARDIAQGMNYLHSHKPQVLHLDLKSMNVLLCESLRAKIADFGFSKLRHEAGSKSKVPGKMKQKPPSWMSPELLDKGDVSCKSDVYSFGIILWEMLCRKIPYDGVSIFKILEMVRKNQRPEIPDGTPEGLHHLISLCWDQNPAKRPQFKDILQMLENLAFPPAWRELFHKAGVPDSALQDVKSTRTIISLVTGTLDSGKTGILHSFMISHSGDKNGNHSEKKKQSSSSDKIESKTSSRQKTSSRSASKVGSKTGTNRSWEAETVSLLSRRESSDDSDFTIKDLEVSSNGSTDERAESSEASSEEETYITRYLKRSDAPKKKLNVFVPNLELSLQSARDEFKAERQRISQESDWTCISLDDRTGRSSRTSQDMSSGVDKDETLKFDTKLRLSSALSSRRSTALSESFSTDTSVNESARSRRRDKNRDITGRSDEYIMRESFDNMRPPSPKKRISLTTKLKSSGRRSVGPRETSTDDTLKSFMTEDSRPSSSRVVRREGWAANSQDSFFGLPVKRVENTDESKDKMSKMTLDSPVTDRSSGLPVEGLENKRDVTEFKKSKTVELNKAKSLVPIEKLENRMGTFVRATVLSPEVQSNIDVRQLQAESANEEKHLSVVEKKLQRENFSTPQESTEDIKRTKYKCENNSKSGDDTQNNTRVVRSSVRKDSFEVSLSKCLNESVHANIKTSNVANEEAKSIDTEKTMVKETENTVIKETKKSEKHQFNGDFVRSKVDAPLGDSIETQVSDNMKTASNGCKHYLEKSKLGSGAENGKSKDIKSQISESTCASNKRATSEVIEQSKVSSAQDSKQTENGMEDIRVKLNLDEMERKKKPAITPRRSKIINKLNDGSTKMPEREKGDIPIRVSLKMMEKKMERKANSEENKTLTSTNTDNSNALNFTRKTLTSESSQKVLGEKKRQDDMGKIQSPKKNTIMVKLRKDPLSVPASKTTTVPSRHTTASPVPPAPPPPPVAEVSKSVNVVAKSVQASAPRTSMADELKSRLAVRQSISEGVKIPDRNYNTKSVFMPVPANRQSRKQPMEPASFSVPKCGAELNDISEMEEKLLPKQSEGLPAFMVQSLELKDQKEHLKSISKPHPHQLDDLSNASQQQLSSIADILRKAVMNRRLALGEDGDSVSQSMESAATGWSIDTSAN